MANYEIMIRQASELAAGISKTMEDMDISLKEDIRDFELSEELLRSHETNMIFAVDATESRREFWKQTKVLQNEMFGTIEGVGSKLKAQLVSYSGATHDKDLYASPWHTSAFVLCEHMAAISCEAGGTQIAKVFKHTLNQALSRDIHALVLVVDSCEESESQLIPYAMQLRSKGIRFFLFDDAERTIFRHSNTENVFKSITEKANGVYAPFDMKSLDVIEDYLKTVAAAATRNPTLIRKLENEISTDLGKKMYKDSLLLLGMK